MQQRPRQTVSEALTPAQRTLLVATLNRIVPARGDLPGAGDLGVHTTIERTLTQDPTLLRLFLDGLRALEGASSDQDFTAQPASHQETRLCEIEATHSTFFSALVEHTYRGYYSLPVVQRSIGLSGEPPQPRGHHLAPFDPALLAVQRQRAPFWRKTE